jgi:gliding motility-associated-like protein
VLNVPAQAGAQYQWLLNGQPIAGANGPEWVVAPAEAADAGDYTLEMTLNGCTVATAPFALSISSGLSLVADNDAAACLDPTDDIFLTATVSGGTAPFTYQWNGMGQNGYVFQTVAQNPVLANVLGDFAGTYVVVVTDANGCTALDSTVVDFTLTPPALAFTANSPVCSGDNLVCTASAVGGGATYSWFLNGNLVQTTATPQWIVANVGAANAGIYTVQLNDNGCSSPLSAGINVAVNLSPNATASVNGPICAGDDLQFNAPFNPQWSYAWSGPAGFSSTVRSPYIPNAGVANSGDYYLVVTDNQNGCFSVVTVTANVEPLPTTPIAGNNSPICLGGSLEIFVAAGATFGATYTWYQANTNLPFDTTLAANGLSVINGLPVGEYGYFVVATSPAGCVSAPSNITEAFVNATVDIAALAGSDVYACETQTANLAATLQAGANGTWLSLGAADVVAPNDPVTAVTDLQPGANVFVWTVTIGTCVGSDNDTAIIWREALPVANADSFYTNLNQSLIFADMFANDDLSGLAGAPTVTFVAQPAHGSVVYNNDGTFTYQPDQGYYGPDSLVYEVCSRFCAGLCDTALVALQVGAFNDCDIPNIITPNNDGTNDALFVPCLDVFTDNSIVIFNRWGDEVFAAAPYLNDWQGTHSGRELPEGTYFYVLRYTDQDGLTVDINGYVMIHR